MDEIGKTTLAKPFRLLGALGKEFWYLLTRRYDLCYLAITCHGVGFLKDSPFILMAKLFRKKIVIHQHNKGMANDVDRWPYRLLLPLCYKDAKVILLSWYLYPDIEKVVKKEDVYICPNGIKVQEFKSSVNDIEKKSRIGEGLARRPKGESQLVNRVPRLLFLSNLIESKGVLVLLDALKILKDKGYSFICDFVGGETKEIDAKRFKDEVEKRGLNEIAIYQGRKYGEEKERILNESDIFIFPTYYDNECFPLVLLEAMLHALPCITADEGGIRDIVTNDTGFTVHGSSKEELTVKTAGALEKLIIDADLRKQMGITGKKRIMEMFTEEVFEKSMKEILWTMISS
jgi:glycosyltransferase involved in cell wall biosynthesis